VGYQHAPRTAKVTHAQLDAKIGATYVAGANNVQSHFQSVGYNAHLVLKSSLIPSPNAMMVSLFTARQTGSLQSGMLPQIKRAPNGGMVREEGLSLHLRIAADFCLTDSWKSAEKESAGSALFFLVRIQGDAASEHHIHRIIPDHATFENCILLPTNQNPTAFDLSLQEHPPLTSWLFWTQTNDKGRLTPSTIQVSQHTRQLHTTLPYRPSQVQQGRTVP
jgi:hypothetical protein